MFPSAMHLTDDERADLRELINKPDIDGEVVLELVSEVSVNELAHWCLCKKEACHKLKVDEPPFTKDELRTICNAGKEGAKRQKFSEIMARKMNAVLREGANKLSTVTINAEDIPKANKLLDKLNSSDRLVSLCEERERLIVEKKRRMKEYTDAINALDEQILNECGHYRSGQGKLFNSAEIEEPSAIQ